MNGIGEASHADFGITGAKNEGLIFAHGKPLRKVPQDDLVDALFAEIDKSLDRGAVEVDDLEAAEGAEWLAQDRGGERRRADARADRQARGREGPRGGQRRDREPFLKPVKERPRSTRTTRRPRAAASPAPDPTASWLTSGGRR